MFIFKKFTYLEKVQLDTLYIWSHFNLLFITYSFHLNPSTSIFLTLFIKAVLIEIQDAGWKRFDKSDDKSAIKEEEILALFNLIDKDGSGSLTKRVCKNMILLFID